MRPVQRGPIPTDTAGDPKVFSKYSQARGDLIERLGQYCSYCGMQLSASLSVEHVRPKGSNPQLELQWDHFLLACPNCNSTKGVEDVVLNDYFWPDRDNTFRAIVYTEGGLVNVNASLTDDQQKRARKTIDLTGLDRTPANDPSASDRRWQNRRQAWNMATEARQKLQQKDSTLPREYIVKLAMAEGFWSVWMTVFADDQDMLQRLIQAFPGTCPDCFDDDCRPVPRPGGAL